MTGHVIQLSEDEFDELYPLVTNHLNPSASWVFGDGPGCLFETYGDELDFVRRQEPDTVWTLVDGDDGDMYVINGLHYVNRIGYLISTLPVCPDLTVEVHIEMNHGEEDDEPEASE